MQFILAFFEAKFKARREPAFPNNASFLLFYFKNNVIAVQSSFRHIHIIISALCDFWYKVQKIERKIFDQPRSFVKVFFRIFFCLRPLIDVN